MTYNFLIYGLIDPRNGQLRYIGKTSRSIKYRLSRHITSARIGRKQHVYCWIRQLLAADLNPDVEVLEICDSADKLIEAEQHHIAYWNFLGADLTNLTMGGEGTVGYKHTIEQRIKNSTIGLGKPLSEKHKAALSVAGLGRKLTSTERIKISFALSGKKHTLAHRINSSKSHGGRSFVDQNGVIYQTRGQAAFICGVAPSSITQVLNGRRKSVRGYVFSYLMGVGDER